MLIKNKPINISEVLDDAKPKGVIHCGAFIGEELPIYQSHGINNRCWIEADPDTFTELKEIIPQDDVALNVAVSNYVGVGSFVVMNNGASSSLLAPKRHLDFYPEIQPIKEIWVDVRTLDFLVECGRIDMSKYDFLYMDLQGGEMDALKGFEEHIDEINFILAEINYEELYEGCALIDEFDAYLKERGFEKQWATIHEAVGWGDAYYKRV